MARGNGQAQAASTTANQNAGTEFGNAESLYGSLAPTLESEAANPSGYAPSDLAGMQTEAQQTAGGTEAGAVGQGAMFGARTRNAGAAPAAIADASRAAGEQLSKNSLGISTGNARLKQQQKQEALGGLEGLTNLETGAANNSLGQVAGNVNANTSAINASYDPFTDIVNPLLQTAGKTATGFAP